MTTVDGISVRYASGRDGVRLAYRKVGEGRPLVLLHGFLADAVEHWVRPGHAEVLAERGHRVIMPDLRGHGASAGPHDPSHYPPDVLADDGIALINHLRLTDYDLGGYSLGGRIALRVVLRSAAARRVVVAGQGLEQVTGAGGGAGPLLRRVLADPGPLGAGTVGQEVDQWLRRTGADRTALLHVLDSVVPTPIAELAGIRGPTLVVGGVDDDRSAAALATSLPRGSFAVVPGDHATAVGEPELAAVMADFLK